MSDKVTVYIAPLEDLPSNIVGQLKVRCHGPWNGRMHDNLRHYGTRAKNATIFYTMENGKVCSWGMVYNYRWAYSGKVSKAWSIDIYTVKKYRGQGYGTVIATAMREEFPDRRLHGCTDLTSIYQRLKMNKLAVN